MQDRREALKDWRDDARPASVPGAALIGKAFNLLDAIGAAPGLVPGLCLAGPVLSWSLRWQVSCLT
jgi:hypothetical protein